MCAFILLYVLPFKSDFKFWDSSAIETARLLFCRPYLEVHNQAPNMASRAKLGKYPMGIDINKKILNYVPVNSKTAHPSPAQNQGHLTFLENFGQIPHYVACLDGQMPHPPGVLKQLCKTFFHRKNRLFKCTYPVINNWLLFGLRFVLTAILMIIEWSAI